MEFKKNDRLKASQPFPGTSNRAPDYKPSELSPGLSTSSRGHISGVDSTYLEREFIRSNRLARDQRLVFASPANTACTILGAVIILFGLIGFGIPSFFGLHMSPANNFIHLFLGGVALYFGLKTPSKTAAKAALTFGTLFGLVALTGFLFGSPGTFSMPLFSGNDPLLWPISRGSFELGASDHVIHALLAIAFLIPAFSSRMKDRNLQADATR